MEKFGFKKEQVDVLRTAHLWFPEEPLFREIPIHVKYNRARRGDFQEGDRVHNMKLLSLATGELESLVAGVNGAVGTPTAAAPAAPTRKKSGRTIFGSFRKNSSSSAKTPPPAKRNGLTVVMAGSYS